MATARRLALALAFGLALSLLHLGATLRLERAVTGAVLQAAASIGIAGFAACLAAATIVPRLAGRPFGARFAAATILIVAGTTGLAALFLAADMLVHSRISVPPGHLPKFLVFAPLAALYGFLGTAGRALMPPGFLLALIAAWHIAGSPR